MEIKSDIIVSQSLNREMSVEVYGHYGISILVFPAITGESTEWKKSGFIDSIEHLIRIGKCKLFCISGVDNDMWLNNSIEPKEKSLLHFNFNKFVEDECVQYIYEQCGGAVPIITAGAANGAFHAANTFFRRPDLFFGTIAISGKYDLSDITGDYFDENCYYNSPMHYLPNLNDSYWLSFLYSRRHIYLASGAGCNESPESSQNLADVLKEKGIRHYIEIWGSEYDHDYTTWVEMFKHFVETRL